MKQGFWQAGHTPTLLSAFLYFDLSFMVWVMLGPLAVQIASDLQLTSSEKGLMVATPVLVGAFLRIVMGALVDYINPKKAGLIGQAVVITALMLAWLGEIKAFQHTLMLGVGLGFAGAAYAVALPLASRWYPPEHQGTALGIVGAGNLSTVLVALFAPAFVATHGWNKMFALVLIPLIIVLIIYILFAKDGPDAPPAKSLSQYLAVLKDKDAWWFMFFYGVTFGGFVGLISSLTIYYDDSFHIGPVAAGYCTAASILAGSIARPWGGMIADRIGGIRTLLGIYSAAAVLLLIMSFGQSHYIWGLAITMPVMLVLGMGNGAVFQLIPQRFRKEIGIMTGLVGMAGCLGGFYLAASLGYVKQNTGSYQIGLMIFAGLTVLALIGLSGVKTRWRTTWGAATATSAKV